MYRTIARAMALVLAFASIGTSVLAQQETKPAPVDLLDAVPAEAWGAVCIPNVARMDQHLTAFLQPLQIPMMMGPPVMMARMMLGLQAGFDDNGGVAISMLPVPQGENPTQSIVILLPVTDYGALMTAMSAEATGDGANKLFFMDKQSYAIPYRKGFAAISKSRAVLNRLTAMKGTLRSRLSDEQRRLWNNTDITVWVDAKTVFSHPMVKAALQSAQQLGINTSSEELEQLGQIQLYTSFEPGGLSLGGYADALPGTDLARAMASVKGTNESLLKGLPNERYLAAVGFQSNKTYTEISARSLDQAIQSFLDSRKIDAEKWGQARKALMTLSRSVIGLSADVVALPNDKTGQMSANVVIRTDGEAAEFQSALAALVEQTKSAIGTGKNSEATEMVSLLSYKKNAEKHEGTRVDHLKFKLPENADAHVREQIQTILGESDVTVRVAAIDKNVVVMTIGGGMNQTARLISAARSNNAALAGDKGISTLSKRVGSKRTMEMYLAVDRLIQVMSKIAPGGMGPMQMPEVDAPILVHGHSVDEKSAGGELFIPMDLLIAIKNVATPAFAAQMGGAPRQQAPPEPQPDEGAPGM